jgi:hypothetical protein
MAAYDAKEARLLGAEEKASSSDVGGVKTESNGNNNNS